MHYIIFAVALLFAAPLSAQENTIKARNRVPVFKWLHDAQTYQALIAQGDEEAARQHFYNKYPNYASRTSVGETLYVMHMRKVGKTFFYCVRGKGEPECAWTDDGAFL